MCHLNIKINEFDFSIFCRNKNAYKTKINEMKIYIIERNNSNLKHIRLTRQ